jgi:thymidylate kinase
VTVEDLIARVPDGRRAANGIPDPETARRRERAHRAVREALGAVASPRDFRISPLGPAWSSDVDVHLGAAPDEAGLRSLGWVPLDAFLTAIGYPGTGRWAVVEDGEVLGTADIHATPPPDPAVAVIERCRRRGEVRVREALELAALARSGGVLPSKDRVLSIAADIEAALGGADLARWRSGKHRDAPVRLASAMPRRIARRVVKPRRTVPGIAICGVDGSGKSTLARLVVRDLERLGLRATPVWTRPGMRIAWLEPVARTAKRLMREEAEPGVLRVAADPDRELRSRKGPLGWTWSMLVTRSFVRDVRHRARAARDVPVYDRHLLDALVTLEFAYRGVDLRRHRALVRRRLPPARKTFYLEITPEIAAARKPGDAIGEAAVRRQLEIYRREIRAMPEVVVLDGSRPAAELARRALVAILGIPEPVTGEASVAPRPR